MKLISIRNLTSKKIIEIFDCGINELNTYLKQYAFENDLNNIGKTYLLVDEDHILGYFTLANGSITHDDLPIEYRKIPKYPIPITRLARLGVDINYQNKGYGRKLIQSVIRIVFNTSLSVASYAIVVDVKPQSKSFYEYMGFEKLNNDLQYFYSMKKIAKYLRNIKDNKK